MKNKKVCDCGIVVSDIDRHKIRDRCDVIELKRLTRKETKDKIKESKKQTLIKRREIKNAQKKIC